MRAIWLGAIFSLVSTAAFAACSCSCVAGNAVSTCSSPLDMPALCQRICLPSVLPPGSPTPSTEPGGDSEGFQERGGRRDTGIGGQGAR